MSNQFENILSDEYSKDPPADLLKEVFAQDPTPFPHQIVEQQKLLPLGIRYCAQLNSIYPPVVIEGLVRQSEILLMGGSAKKWKSWARADMLYCIGNGFKWLKFPCHKGTVIHLDLELLEADLRWRFEQIHQSYCTEGFKGTLDNLRFVPLRDMQFSMTDLDACAEQLLDPHHCMLSVDPIYPLLGSKTESDPAAVTELLTKLRHLGKKIESSVALVQHFTKGDQSSKEAQDRFSGTRIWNAFPDSLMTFTDLADEHCFSCEFTLRSFQPIEKFGVRWDFPRFRIDEALDPEKLKIPGRPKESNAEQLCSILTTGEFVSHADFCRRAQKVLGISEATFNRRLKEAKSANMLFLSSIENAYGLSPEYCKRNGQ